MFCSEIFTRIGNAYEILGDPQQRELYDQHSMMDLINDVREDEVAHHPRKLHMVKKC